MKFHIQENIKPVVVWAEAIFTPEEWARIQMVVPVDQPIILQGAILGIKCRAKLGYPDGGGKVTFKISAPSYEHCRLQGNKLKEYLLGALAP